MPDLPPLHRWDVPSPRGLVHVVHGMAEYGARYARLAAALNLAGYAVWAHDHRGHGEHMWLEDGSRLPGHFGDRDGWHRLLDDTTRVSGALQASSPGTPLLLFAHSMGSFVGQALLAGSGERYRGVVLCGSNGRPGAVERSSQVLAHLERRLRGPRTPSRWLHRAVLGRYNQPFAPNRTDVDWLSRDAAEVDAYVADPMCGFPLTTQAWLDLLQGRRSLGDARHLAKIPKALPVRLIAGSKDPVGEQGAGVRRLFEAYRDAGLTHVSLQLYPDARHELVNETNREQITADLIAWFEQTVARPS